MIETKEKRKRLDFLPPQPVREGTAKHGLRYSNSQRVQCLTLMSLRLDPNFIEQSCGIPPGTQRKMWRKARDRGYNPAVDSRIFERYVQDGTRSGRPKKNSTTTSKETTEEGLKETSREEDEFSDCSDVEWEDEAQT